jgi:hypothetical protein
MEIKEIPIEKIKLNPYQARVEFPEEKLKEMSATIKRKEIGLLQLFPSEERVKVMSLIMGEMRVRAAKMAGLTKMPAMIKDVDDKGVALQALIENMQRTDLKPIPKARGLFEYYKLAGNFVTSDVTKIKSALKIFANIGTRELKRRMTDFEKKVKEIADTVGLSYRQQSALISHLKLDSDEQEHVNDLGIDSDKIERIATIEGRDARLQMIEIAPELNKEEFSKTVTVINKAPEHLKKEVLNFGSKITPEIATTILAVKDEEDQKTIVTKVKKEEMSADRTEKLVSTIKKSTDTVKKAILKPKSRITSGIAETILTLEDERAQEEVIREVEEYRLDEEETKSVVGQIIAYKDEISPSEEEWRKVKERYDKMEADTKAFLETPEGKRRGKIFRNWLAHGNLGMAVQSAMCPICGAGPENLVWKCHNLTIEEAMRKATEAFQNSMPKRKGKEKEKKL